MMPLLVTTSVTSVMVAARHAQCGTGRHRFGLLADRWVLDDDHPLVDRLRVSLVDVERTTGAVVVDQRYTVRDRPVGGAVPHHHAQSARAGLAAGALPGRAAVVAVEHEPDLLPGDAFGGALDGDFAVGGCHQPVQVLVVAQ